MALYKDPKEKSPKQRCVVCDGDLEASNLGTLCNACKDRIRAGK